MRNHKNYFYTFKGFNLPRYMYPTLIIMVFFDFQGVKAVKEEFDETTLSRATHYRPPGKNNLILHFFSFI